MRVVDDPARGLAPKELANCVIRTLSLPEIAEIRSELRPEFPLYSAKINDACEEVMAGIADAVAFAKDGTPLVVIDWKSDVDPESDTIEHYRSQVGAYLEMTGAERGLVVLVTTGNVIAVKRQQALSAERIR